MDGQKWEGKKTGKLLLLSELTGPTALEPVGIGERGCVWGPYIS